jgi:hypothetical protein
MRIATPFLRRAAFSRPAALSLVSLLAAAAACGDRADPVSAPPPAAAAPRAPALLAAVQCTADRRAATLRCGEGTLPASARGYIIVGGQHQYVDLASANVAYDAGTGAFTFDVTVQNLIPQPLGTTDGTTPDPAGVRVIFHSGPTATGGTGTVGVVPDGVGTFTAAGQPYYQYAGNGLGGDGILSQNETSSARTWTLTMPSTVTASTFQLYVVAEVPHPNGYVDVSPAADTMLSGGTTTLAATVRSAVGNAVPGQPITWGTSDPSVATVDASGVVTAVGPGAVSITATAGARGGAAALQVCPSLAVGGVYVSADAKFCVGTGGSAAEYTVTPVNLGVSDLPFSITGAGIVPVTGPPTPLRLSGTPALQVPPRLAPDEALHLRLMEADRAAAAAVRGGRAARGPARRNIVPGVPSVGTVMNLNVDEGYCSPVTSRAATVKSVGLHVVLMEDNTNPAGGFSTAQYDSIAAAFDALVFPAVAGNFGAPFDIDANSRIIALYTAAVNDLTPAASASYVAGRFRSRDLFGTSSCAGSNQGEMLYMLAPDPTGAHGNVRSAAFVRSVTVRALAHEYQHLVNASRRLYGGGVPAPFEQVWLDEGLAHVAEEEVYYASTQHGPGENLGLAAVGANATQTDRFFEFAEPNLALLRQWLLRPDTAGPFEDAGSDAVGGAAWSFLRYAADRKGGIESTLWSGLAASADTGMTNLAGQLGTDPKPWFRDWAAAMYLDDSGTGPGAAYTQPSWNFRSLYAGLDYLPGAGCSCAYELAVRNPANGVAQSFTLSRGAGAAYVRMGVPASGFAGVTTTAPSSSLAVMVMRTK